MSEAAGEAVEVLAQSPGRSRERVVIAALALLLGVVVIGSLGLDHLSAHRAGMERGRCRACRAS